MHECVCKKVGAEAVALSLEMDLQMDKQRSPEALQEKITEAKESL